jgi:hypothetical protein
MAINRKHAITKSREAGESFGKVVNTVGHCTVAFGQGFAQEAFKSIDEVNKEKEPTKLVAAK